ncbi:MAG TPA: lipid-A-disaccharide synthase [Planctomycetota bacterium]|nr:lipid-A-disaccharide synthase [Planctomycetota bacterium]
MADAPLLQWVAGEPSGDNHAARVLAALNDRLPGVRHIGLGGRRMAAAGLDLAYDLAGDAVMGIFPVLKAAPRILRLLSEAEESLARNRPDALVLVDYPGFNYRLAARAKRHGVPVVWYVAPQVWAWGAWRLKRTARLVDRLLCILPFEAEIFRRAGVDARFVGHPVFDHLAGAERDPATRRRLAELRGDGPLIGLFPGSRGHVVDALAKDFLDACRRFRERVPTARIAVAAAQERFAARIAAAFPEPGFAEIFPGRSVDVMEACDLALTTSGTTTLEIAAVGRPFVLAYRVSPVFYAVARSLVNVGHVGLVNLVAGRGVVPEHVGFRSSAAAAADDLLRLWNDPSARAAQLAGLAEVRAKLDVRGAYARAADEIADFVLGRRGAPAATPAATQNRK